MHPAYILLGYLLGSIPFGWVLTRFAGLGDIRSIGSGGIGATNVLRTGRTSLAVGTLLLDAAKGAVAVLLAGALAGPDAGLWAGAGAVLGHCFPVWLGFRGGKGVATGLGVSPVVRGVIECAGSGAARGVGAGELGRSVAVTGGRGGDLLPP